MSVFARKNQEQRISLKASCLLAPSQSITVQVKIGVGKNDFTSNNMKEGRKVTNRGALWGGVIAGTLMMTGMSSANAQDVGGFEQQAMICLLKAFFRLPPRALPLTMKCRPNSFWKCLTDYADEVPPMA